MRRDQFHRVFPIAGDIACGPAGVNQDVLPDGPAQLLQPLEKRRRAGLRIRIVRGERHVDFGMSATRLLTLR
jgi:hypothetical protein